MKLLEWIVRSNTAHGPVPYIFMDVCHKYGCPKTRQGSKYGPCNCGGDQLKAELDAVMLRAELVVDHTVCGCQRTKPTVRKKHNESIFLTCNHICPNPIVQKAAL